MEKTGIKLIDTFVYSGKEFLDKRVFCENISELKATDATSIPEGFMRYVKSEQKWYKYDLNSVSSFFTISSSFPYAVSKFIYSPFQRP